MSPDSFPLNSTTWSALEADLPKSCVECGKKCWKGSSKVCHPKESRKPLKLYPCAKAARRKEVKSSPEYQCGSQRSLGCERKPPRAYRVSVEITLGLK